MDSFSYKGAVGYGYVIRILSGYGDKGVACVNTSAVWYGYVTRILCPDGVLG